LLASTAVMVTSSVFTRWCLIFTARAALTRIAGAAIVSCNLLSADPVTIVSAPCRSFVANLTRVPFGPLIVIPLARLRALPAKLTPLGRAITTARIDGASRPAVSLNERLALPSASPALERLEAAGRPPIVHLNVVRAEPPPASVADTVTADPPAVIGVPEMSPVARSIDKPSGRPVAE